MKKEARFDAGCVVTFDTERAAAAAVYRRYVDVQAFHEAVSDFFGATAYVVAPGAVGVSCACCPSCRSKARPEGDPRRFPIVIEQYDDGRWSLSAWCGCTTTGIVRALVEAERAMLDAELDALGRLEEAA